jgi:CO/xanthine dehydrogenase FAD-binding subunit
MLGGGTDLIPKMKQKEIKPENIITIKKIPGFDTIESDDQNSLTIV